MVIIKEDKEGSAPKASPGICKCNLEYKVRDKKIFILFIHFTSFGYSEVNSILSVQFLSQNECILMNALSWNF